MIESVFLVVLPVLLMTGCATPKPRMVEMPPDKLIAYLEGELSYPNEEKLELKIQRIENQMKLLESVTNADSPQVWQYRHDKLEYLLGCLYLEAGNRQLAYQHLKTCVWNCGQYDLQARKVLERSFRGKDSHKAMDNDRE